MTFFFRATQFYVKSSSNKPMSMKTSKPIFATSTISGFGTCVCIAVGSSQRIQCEMQKQDVAQPRLRIVRNTRSEMKTERKSNNRFPGARSNPTQSMREEPVGKALCSKTALVSPFAMVIREICAARYTHHSLASAAKGSNRMIFTNEAPLQI